LIPLGMTNFAGVEVVLRSVRPVLDVNRIFIRVLIALRLRIMGILALIALRSRIMGILAMIAGAGLGMGRMIRVIGRRLRNRGGWGLLAIGMGGMLRVGGRGGLIVVIGRMLRILP